MASHPATTGPPVSAVNSVQWLLILHNLELPSECNAAFTSEPDLRIDRGQSVRESPRWNYITFILLYLVLPSCISDCLNQGSLLGRVLLYSRPSSNTGKCKLKLPRNYSSKDISSYVPTVISSVLLSPSHPASSTSKSNVDDISGRCLKHISIQSSAVMMFCNVSSC